MKMELLASDIDDESFALEAFTRRFDVKEIHIEDCHELTDRGIEAASVFLPSLEKITIKNCKQVTEFVRNIIATNSEATKVIYEAAKEKESDSDSDSIT